MEEKKIKLRKLAMGSYNDVRVQGMKERKL